MTRAASASSRTTPPAARQRWALEVRFPLSRNLDPFAATDRLVEAVGRQPSGAGTGFGWRDASWYDLTRSQALWLERKVRRAARLAGVGGLEAEVVKQTW